MPTRQRRKPGTTPWSHPQCSTTLLNGPITCPIVTWSPRVTPGGGNFAFADGHSKMVPADGYHTAVGRGSGADRTRGTSRSTTEFSPRWGTVRNLPRYRPPTPPATATAPAVETRLRRARLGRSHSRSGSPSGKSGSFNTPCASADCRAAVGSA